MRALAFFCARHFKLSSPRFAKSLIHPWFSRRNDELIPTDQGTITLLGERAVWAGAIALHDSATSEGLDASVPYEIEDGNHMSAVDPENDDLISGIAEFVRSPGR